MWTRRNSDLLKKGQKKEEIKSARYRQMKTEPNKSLRKCKQKKMKNLLRNRTKPVSENGQKKEIKSVLVKFN
jgi:hypothetical protein